MKKFVLILLTFVPILVGYLINSTVLVPVLGIFMLYVVPLLVLVFWFFLGSMYSKTDWNAAVSILIGSATGVLSLALYLWQFLLESDETRNMFLAALSQMYSASTPTYLTVKLAMLFETQPNFIGSATYTAMQVIAVILMAAIFTAGYFWGRKRQMKEESIPAANPEQA